MDHNKINKWEKKLSTIIWSLSSNCCYTKIMIIEKRKCKSMHPLEVEKNNTKQEIYLTDINMTSFI